MHFTIELHPNHIIVQFPSDPSLDEKGRKIIAMLFKADFERQPKYRFIRDRTDFWVGQCRKLAQKFGATVKESPNITSEPPNITDPTIAELKQQMAAMQSEINRLRGEVEELKKFDANE
ncbi:MAG TPA: hypothetical protein V6D33_13510 [Cyanophyceae cyanobacterium]